MEHRHRLASASARCDWRAPSSFALARTWRAVSPDRQCPRRSGSIPTLGFGSVPPRAPMRSGLKFLYRDGNIGREDFVPGSQQNCLWRSRDACDDLRCLCIIRGGRCAYLAGRPARPRSGSGAQFELDAQPFSASAFSARLVHNSAISRRIAF